MIVRFFVPLWQSLGINSHFLLNGGSYQACELEKHGILRDFPLAIIDSHRSSQIMQRLSRSRSSRARTINAIGRWIMYWALKITTYKMPACCMKAISGPSKKSAICQSIWFHVSMDCNLFMRHNGDGSFLGLLPCQRVGGQGAGLVCCYILERRSWFIDVPCSAASIATLLCTSVGIRRRISPE